jgi:recombination protein RecA
MENSKIRSLADTINKKYGKGSFDQLNKLDLHDVEGISTGSLGLNLNIGKCMGFPRGRIVEIYGPESSGKTTLLIHAIANAQKAGLAAALIDVEHAFDPSYAEALGVDCDELWFCQPNSAEEALNILEDCLKSKQFAIIGVDSVAGLVPQAEVEGEMGESKIGIAARLMSQCCRKIVPLASDANTAVIFINQLREKIGVMFGSPEVTTGGNALKFYSSVRIDIRRAGASVKNGEEMIGNPTKVKIVKNKLGPPFKTNEFLIMFGEGVSKESELVQLGEECQILEKSGSWYGYSGSKLAQGKAQMIQYFKDNPEFGEFIESEIVKFLKPE